jgi:hypothetical protein
MKPKLVTILLVLCLCSCRSDLPTDPVSQNLVISHSISHELTTLLEPFESHSAWYWETTERAGTAELEVINSSYKWELSDYNPQSEDNCNIMLHPDDINHWHSIITDHTKLAKGLSPPIPITPITSPEYNNIMDFLSEMTGPRYDRIVTHWVGEIIPVQVDSFETTTLNLSDALSHAVTVWNEIFEYDIFDIGEYIPWGVRLIYRPGMQTPPLYIRGIRQDNSGHPMLMHIIVGDNYNNSHSNIWINRAMVHELTHALCLWGHSKDREHILWENGPIVDVPSNDEIIAIKLWIALPDGLNLNDYTTVNQFYMRYN